MITGTGGRFAVTLSVAAPLVTLPASLLTTTRNTAPSSPSAASPSVYLAPFASGISTPSRCHWYVNGPGPLPLPVNVAGCPTDTVLDTGPAEITGKLPSLKLTFHTLPVSGSLP